MIQQLCYEVYILEILLDICTRNHVQDSICIAKPAQISTSSRMLAYKIMNRKAVKICEPDSVINTITYLKEFVEIT